MRIFEHEERKPTRSRRFAELFGELGEQEMSGSNGGDFTRNFLSLQLQLQTLMEGVGGEGTASLLDGLARLTDTERNRIIPHLSRVVHRIAQGEKRLFSEQDQQLQHFEDILFESLSRELGHSANDDEPNAQATKKLSVVSGGKHLATKPVKIPSLIDLAKAREHRRVRFDTSPDDAS